MDGFRFSGDDSVNFALLRTVQVLEVRCMIRDMLRDTGFVAMASAMVIDAILMIVWVIISYRTFRK